MNPRKILIFSLVYYPRFIGGAEIATKEITDRINRAEYEFHMITLHVDKTLPKEEIIGNVRIFRVGFVGNLKNQTGNIPFPLLLNKYLLPFIGFLKARRLHKKFHYDAVWSMMANYAGFAALFFKLTHKKVPFILSLQEGDPISHIKKRVGILYGLFRRIFIKADLIQVISVYLGDFARSMGYKGEVVVIPNAVDTKHFGKTYAEEELNKLKSHFHKKEKDIFLVTTSRLVVKNALSDVIRSLQFLPDNIKFLIIGRGREEQNLKKLARDLDVDRRVFFEGFVDHIELPKYLKISDIFIRPSLSEGFGNSFVEAMASGIPVIATPVGGIVDFLYDPDKNPKDLPTGIFVKVNDPRDIAKQVTHLLQSPALRKQIIVSAEKMVKEKYDWDIIAQDMQKKVFEPITKNV